ncbi:MAG TPA: hypothetical protein VIU61_14585, partial [Kofleriaceae bacterium]
MSTAGEICWKRFYAGRNPSQLVVARSRVVCSYIDDQREAGTPGRHKVVCLDLEGQERWSARDFELKVALPDDRLLGVTRSGKLRTLTLDGRKADGVHDGTKRVRVEEVVEVSKSSQHVLVTTKTELVVTDIALNVVGRFPSPPDGRAIFVGDRVLALKGNEIVQWDRRGRADTLCQIP